MIALRASSADRPLLLASAARFFIAGFNRMPSTALIFAKPARPMTKLVLLGFPVGRFCFGMLGVYQISDVFAMSKDLNADLAPILCAHPYKPYVQPSS
jgi:hypothetical protein